MWRGPVWFALRWPFRTNMPRAREDCRALPDVGPGVAIREAHAAQAIGPRSEVDIRIGNSLGFLTRNFEQIPG